MTDDTPYDEIDPACVRLCRFLNTEFPGITTSESCQGFIDGHRPGHPWSVYFKIDRRARNIRTAVESLEWLTWMINGDLARSDKGRGVSVGLNSYPPRWNREPLYFYITGAAEQAPHPDQIAEAIGWYLQKLTEGQP